MPTGIVKAWGRFRLNWVTDALQRIRIAQQLGSHPAATEALVNYVTDLRENVRTVAIKAIAQLRPTDLLEALVSRIPLIGGFGAVEAIGELGYPSGIPHLVPLLIHWSPLWRQAAAGSLQRLGWQPKDTRSKLYWIINRQTWHELAALGTEGKSLLTETLTALMDADRASTSYSNSRRLLIEQCTQGLELLAQLQPRGHTSDPLHTSASDTATDDAKAPRALERRILQSRMDATDRKIQTLQEELVTLERQKDIQLDDGTVVTQDVSEILEAMASHDDR